MFFIIETIIKIILVIAIFSALGGFMTIVERKVLASFHRRFGPMVVGPFGLMQILADGIKLFCKENIIPSRANAFLFTLAPVLSASFAIIAMAPIPFFPSFTLFGHKIDPIISDLNVAILFILGVSACGLYGALLGGLASGSKYSLIGGARAVVQLLSFEVVSGISILAPIMLVGSLSLLDFNSYQSGGISSWLVWKQPLAFLLFLIAGYAETNRVPFDLLETETEIVSGYITEYSGLAWGLFFIAEYASMIALCFVVSLLFLGGFNPLGFIPGGLAILLKVAFLLFLFLWIRAAWPHIRPDQLMGLCWRTLFPLALLNILITGFFVV